MKEMPYSLEEDRERERENMKAISFHDFDSFSSRLLFPG